MKEGDHIYVGGYEGIVSSTLTGRYFVFFEARDNEGLGHKSICTKLHDELPGFIGLANKLGAPMHESPEAFPAFKSLNELTTFINILNGEPKNENRLQKSKTSICRGDVPEGHQISCRKGKVTISSGHLSYRVCHF